MSTSGPSTPGASPLSEETLKHLRRSRRRIQLRAFALVTPVLVFLLYFFLIPIGDMLTRSVYDPRAANWLPESSEALQEWNRQGLPGEETYASLANELVKRAEDGKIGRLALVINHEQPGARTLIMKTASMLKGMEPDEIDSYKEALVGIDGDWGKREIWSALKTVSSHFTARYYLAGLDFQYNVDGEIISVPEHSEIYVTLLVRTLWASAAIMGLCLLLGYPVAYQLANSPPGTGNLLLILVLLPFWTSLLVRTASWIVLLQEQGTINDLLVAVGLISDEGRLRMVYNMIGTIVAMTHIMLPFMILPMYAVMRRVPPDYMRAAQSLGATPPRAFLGVYLPQTLPGVGAGCILVFILSIGFYITPALVGGRTGQFISKFVAYHIQQSVNWGLGAALAGIILISVLALYLLYSRLFGVQVLRAG